MLHNTALVLATLNNYDKILTFGFDFTSVIEAARMFITMLEKSAEISLIKNTCQEKKDEHFLVKQT